MMEIYQYSFKPEPRISEAVHFTFKPNIEQVFGKLSAIGQAPNCNMDMYCSILKIVDETDTVMVDDNQISAT